MTHPREINATTVDCYAVANLRVYGHSTVGACVGILRPRVLVDRAMQLQPGFEALMYHEGTHAHERHRFAGLLLIGTGLLSFALFVTFGILWLSPVPVLSLAGWLWWCRRMETRADAVALYGAGSKEFFAFLQRVGTPKTRWGRWCYGASQQDRTMRASRECIRRGWNVRA